MQEGIFELLAADQRLFTWNTVENLEICTTKLP